MGKLNQLKKKRPVSKEQREFIAELKDKQIKEKQERIKQEFLNKHKLVEIKTPSQARKTLNELNTRCGNCSRLLNNDEIRLRNKLEEVLNTDIVKSITINKVNRLNRLNGRTK